MALSSALALLRGFAVAQVLSPSEFGRYAVVVASGIFCSSLLGWGAIERTNKRFPRLFTDGHGYQALVEADRICWSLLRRFSFVGSGSVAISLVWRTDLSVLVLAAALISFSTAVQLVYTSVHRSSGDLSTIGPAFLARNILTLLFALVGAVMAGPMGAVIGELIATLAGSWISRRYATRLTEDRSKATSIKVNIPDEERDIWLFLAFLLASTPLYLDRLVVTTLFGEAATGTYSLLMLFVTGSVTFCTIIVQKVGPQLVRLQRSGASLSIQTGVAGTWIGITLLVVIGAVLAGGLSFQMVMPILAGKYQVGYDLLLPTAVLATLQFSMFLDWLLLSHDREGFVFVSACIYFMGLVVATILAAYHTWSLPAFLWGMVGAKLAHTSSLALFSASLSRPMPSWSLKFQSSGRDQGDIQ